MGVASIAVKLFTGPLGTVEKNIYDYKYAQKYVHIHNTQTCTHMHTLVAIIYILAHEQTHTQPQCTNSYIYTAIAHYHIIQRHIYVYLYNIVTYCLVMSEHL